MKELLNYIKENIYCKMDKKDVEAIRKLSLSGGLIDQIVKYKNQCVLEAIKKERNNLKVQLSSLEGTIKRLREEGAKGNERYRTGSVID